MKLERRSVIMPRKNNKEVVILFLHCRIDGGILRSVHCSLNEVDDFFRLLAQSVLVRLKKVVA